MAAYTTDWTPKKWIVESGVDPGITDLAATEEMRFDGTGLGSGSNLKNKSRGLATWGEDCTFVSPATPDPDYVTMNKSGAGSFVVLRDTRDPNKVRIWCYVYRGGPPPRLPPLHGGTPTQACWTASDGG